MKLLHFSDLHIGIENYGRINPATGLHTRLEDFLVALDTVIDTALKENVDLVLLAGDIFHVNEPSPTHQKTFAERILRLSREEIPTVMLVGNHDQTNRYGESHSLGIYKALNIPNVYVSGLPELLMIPTRSGSLQIVTLPHVSRSGLMTGDSRNQSMYELDLTIAAMVDQVLDGFVKKLDPNIPAILAAHAGIEHARIGSEHNMSIGYGFTLPLTVVARSQFQYVALGHVHKHQILCTDPPVVYPGSMERVDFGEEKEDKGFVLVDIPESGLAQFSFVPLVGRRFVTVETNLCNRDHPTEILLKAIDNANIGDCIVRIIYTIEAHRIKEIDPVVIRKALEPAFFFSIRPILSNESVRTRVPDLDEHLALNPLKALERYLIMREDLHDIREDLLDRTARLLECEGNR